MKRSNRLELGASSISGNHKRKGAGHDQEKDSQLRAHQAFLASLNQEEILLYLFLVLVSDRHGLSFYSYDAICSLLQFSLDEYIEARDRLIEKDLIAFDGTVFQVLDLPQRPVPTLAPDKDSEVGRMFRQSLQGVKGGR